MSNLAYTVQGTFNQNGKFNLAVCIPTEPFAGAYTLELFNMSIITADGQINAIFCHFSDPKNEEIVHDSFDYKLNFNNSDLKSFRNATDFNETMDDTLILFFHNTPFEYADRAAFFSEIETYYNDVKQNGNSSRFVEQNKTTGTSSVPRKVGMSIVVKL